MTVDQIIEERRKREAEEENRQRRITKILGREDEAEGQKNISKIQMWKPD